MVHYPDPFAQADRLRGVESNVAAIARHLGVLEQPPIGADPEPAEPGPTAPEVQVAGANLDQAGSSPTSGYRDAATDVAISGQTPALARATEAHEETWSSLAAEMQEDAAHGDTPMDEGEVTRRIVHATVSAALHNPDDDVIARTLVEHTRTSGIHGDCLCGHVVPLGGSFAVHQADAVRAAILGARGEASTS